MSRPDSICQIDFSGAVIKTGKFRRSCRYHRVQGQKFCGPELSPRGFCPHAFNAGYPFALALLYDARYPDSAGQLGFSFQARCPSPDPSVFFRISIRRTMPEWLRKLKKWMVRFLQRLHIPAEYPDKAVFFQMTKIEGQCPQGLRAGDFFSLNIKNRAELCPASFHAVYPVLMAPDSGSVPAQDGKNPCRIHCPDPDGVFYVGERKKWECEDFFPVIFERKPADYGKEQAGFPEKIFSSEDLLPQGFCPLAFYSLYPYYQTLLHGGEFEWVPPGGKVRVQCPKVDGIAMTAELLRADGPGKGVIRISIEDVLGHCPKKHQKSQQFDFSTEDLNLASLRDVLARVVPFMPRKDRGEVYCVSSQQEDATWRVAFYG